MILNSYRDLPNTEYADCPADMPYHNILMAFQRYLGCFGLRGGVNDKGITFGPYVQGLEDHQEATFLAWPIELQELNGAIDEAVGRYDEIWKQTHGCPNCWNGDDVEHPDWNYPLKPIDPDCTTCEGEGTLI
jgi:hypothetical protein